MKLDMVVPLLSLLSLVCVFSFKFFFSKDRKLCLSHNDRKSFVSLALASTQSSVENLNNYK